MDTQRTLSGLGLCRHLLGRRLMIASVALAGVALLAGCAPTAEQSGPMIDPQVDFGAYETFGWYKASGGDESGEPLSLVDGAVRDAIVAELQRKGYVEAPAGSTADFLIDYHAERAEKVKSSPFRIGIGVGSYGSHGGASIGTSTSGVRNVSEGSLVIHVIDPVRQIEVWRNGASRELGKGSVEREVVRSVVAEILAKFPARNAAP